MIRQLTFFILLIPILTQGQIVIEEPMIRQIAGGMNIHSIEISDTQTIIKAYCVNDAFRPSALISTSPPGENNAFRLIANKKIYRLKNCEGLAYAPESLTLNYGDTIDFTLIFAPIPKNTKVIDLVEGASEVESAWMLYGIQLQTPNANNSIFTKKEDFINYFKVNNLKLWEIEGFWSVDLLYNKTNNEQLKMFPEEEVVIVRENNMFEIYNLQGQRLGFYFKHYKKEKFVFTFPAAELYPYQKVFKYEPDFSLDFSLGKRYCNAIDLPVNSRVSCLFEWHKIE